MAQTTAQVKQLQGVTWVGKGASNHWVMMDGPEEFGGSRAATSPKELILLGLAGCTGSDVTTILQKKRVKLDGFEMNLTADISEGHPKVYTKINIEFVFYGEDIKEKDVERAIELSKTKYCGVSAMLEKSVDITHTVRIEASK